MLLYNAIFIPPGHEKPPIDIVDHPDISVYIKEFGREDDLCLVAEIDGEIAGAIWTRHFTGADKGYGFINPGTPELCMSVFEQFQRKGIGTSLLTEMIKLLTDKGYDQVSLSVDLINHAYDLYKRFGFEDYTLVDQSMTMLKKLKYLYLSCR